MKLNFLKKGQYLYELQNSDGIHEIFTAFFGALPESDVDYVLEEEVIKSMITYVVARYVYSKNISYAEMWNNVEIIIPARVINDFIPDFNKNIKMSVSKADYIDPLTKENEVKRIYSAYEYE